MNILMIVFNQVNRGTYFRAYSLAKELAACNHEITLMATSVSEKFRVKTYKVENVNIIETPDLTSGPLRSGWDLWNILQRLKWVDRKRFDLVQIFETRPTVIYPALKLYKRNTPIFMDWADWFGKGGSVEERKNPFVRTVLRPIETYYEEHFRSLARGTSVISRALYNRAIELGISKDRLIILPNGANLKDFFPVDKKVARENMGIMESDIVIGYMGAIFFQDAQFMINSFNLVRQRFPAAKLLITGYCPFDFSKLIADSDSIIQTGNTSPDLLNMALNCCDVLWLPFKDSQANRGRLPLKATDYLAVGKPIVSTDVGDLSETLLNGRFGAVVPDEPDLFADATIELINDVDKRNTLGEEARQYALDHLQWSKAAHRLNEFYEKLLSVV